MTKNNTFLLSKINNYFKTSHTPLKCINYLKHKYPHKLNTYDHMAFRSISTTNFNQLSSHILSEGFEQQPDIIEIPVKKRTDVYKFARWYKNNNFIVPRIFLSMGYTTMYHDSIINSTNSHYCNLCQVSHNSIDYRYKKLQQLGDDYIPWTFLHGDEINHIAINMSDYENFEEVILQMAKDLNLDMNNNNNNIFQISNDKKLIQCSTKSDDFYDQYPKNYIEFVKRIDGREGFEGNNAYSIFKSTDKN